MHLRQMAPLATRRYDPYFLDQLCLPFVLVHGLPAEPSGCMAFPLKPARGRQKTLLRMYSGDPRTLRHEVSMAPSYSKACTGFPMPTSAFTAAVRSPATWDPRVRRVIFEAQRANRPPRTRQ